MELKDKIFMENENIKIRNEIQEKAKTYFKKYVGEKILISGGVLLKKIKDDVEFKEIINVNNYKIKPLHDGFVSLNIFTNSGGYSLKIVVKLCFNGGSYDDRTYYCVYVEHVVYVGQVENDVLQDIIEGGEIPLIDFDLQENYINLFKEKSVEIKAVQEKIHHTLRDFIKYDLVK